MKTVEIPMSSKYHANIARYGNNGNSCVVCGKKTNETLFIHATTDWVAINEKDEKKVKNSQGLFPIGSECAKLFPPDFIFTL